MKKLLTLIAVSVFTMLFQACERQDWNETKMFHDVPKKAGAAGETHHGSAAEHAKGPEKAE